MDLDIGQNVGPVGRSGSVFTKATGLLELAVNMLIRITYGRVRAVIAIMIMGITKMPVPSVCPLM